jgi:class 3 adenylate cyclase
VEGSPVRAYLSAPQAPERLYRSNLQTRWLEGNPTVRWQQQEGTLLLLDFSSFIRGAERMLRRRKMEAHQLSAVLDIVFGELLDVAAAVGGDCLKVGAGGPLFLFSGNGHGDAAEAGARRMMQAVRNFQQFRGVTGLEYLSSTIRTRSGRILLALAGQIAPELVVVCPAMGPAGRRGSGRRLALVDQAGRVTISRGSWHSSASAGIPPALADALARERQTGMYRTASIGCVTFYGAGRLLHDAGPDALSRAVDDLADGLHSVAADYNLTWLGSELEGDIGRVTLAAGLPVPASDDTQRLVDGLRVALERIEGPLQVRAGVDHGRVFAADVGSASRRGYMVVGDTVAAAAQLAGRADAGQVLASQSLRAPAPVGILA